MVFDFETAYAVTEDAQHRDLDGPSANILTDIISNALPIDKKDKLTDMNNVSFYDCNLSKRLMWFIEGPILQFAIGLFTSMFG